MADEYNDDYDKQEQIEILEEICEYLNGVVCEDLFAERDIDPVPEPVPDESFSVMA